MTHDDYRNILHSRLNKDQFGNIIKPSRYNDAAKYANLELFKLRFGVPEIVGNVNGWQTVQKITDDMVPFIVTTGEDGVALTVIDSNGYASLPSDFHAYSSLVFPKLTNATTGYTEETIEVATVTDEVFNRRIASLRKQPGERNPIATMRNGKIRFQPKDLQRARLTYLKVPAEPNFDFNISSGQAVYLPPGSTHDGTNPDFSSGAASTSVEFEWPDSAATDLISFMVDFLSDTMRDQVIDSGVERRKQMGV